MLEAFRDIDHRVFIIQYLTYTFIIRSLKLKLGDAAYIMVLNNAYIYL